jgi:hypothetical protein
MQQQQRKQLQLQRKLRAATEAVTAEITTAALATLRSSNRSSYSEENKSSITINY